jgi:hypothetical protein
LDSIIELVEKSWNRDEDIWLQNGQIILDLSDITTEDTVSKNELKYENMDILTFLGH